MMLRRQINFILLLCLCSTKLAYAGWTSPIYNYSWDDYHAGTQNWQIIQQNDNKMYFANNDGILEFNGNSWKLLFPRIKNVRAVQCSKGLDRIYVGSIGEFGYLEPNKTGKLSYEKMSKSLPEKVEGENFWHIYEYEDTLYFISDHKVVKFVSNKLDTIISRADKITCANLIGQTLYMATNADSIYKLNSKKIEPFKNIKGGEKIKGIYSLGNNSLLRGKKLIATELKLFLLDEQEKKITEFETNVDSFISKNKLFSVAVSNKYIAIGTVYNGLVIINYNGKAVQYINQSNGLQNNTVLSVLFDKYENLWLGLDDGISYVELNSPLTNLYSLPNFYGAGYDAILHKKRLYLATNRGLYYSEWEIPISEKSTELNLIEGLIGQVWSIDLVNDDLFCSSDKGLFLIKILKEKPSLEQVDKITGVWGIKKIGADSIEVNTYDTVYVFERGKDKQWSQKGKKAEKGPINSKSNFQRVDTLIASQKYDVGWQGRNEVLWYLNPAYVRKQNIVYPHNLLLIDNFEQLVFLENDDNRAIICSRSGFSLWDAAHHKNKDKRYKLIFINEVYIGDDSLFYKKNDSEREDVNQREKIKYANNRIRFQYGLSSFIKHPQISYRCCLINESDNDSTRSETQMTFMQYSKLEEGKYTFYVDALLNDSILSTTPKFEFEISPPFYRSNEAYCAYGVLVISFLIGIYLWVKRHIKKRERKIQLETNIDNIRDHLQSIVEHIDIKDDFMSNGKEKIKKYLDNEHSDFMEKLLKRCPNLNWNELRTCAAIKIGFLTSKDIALFLNVNYRTIETWRLRMRKKFNLKKRKGKKDKLIDFLEKL